MPFSENRFLSSDSVQQSLPLALGPASRFWANRDDEVTVDLARQYVELQVDNDARLFTSLQKLVDAMADLEAAPTQVPPQILGRLDQPDGSPAAHVQVSIPTGAGATTAAARDATAITAADGTFVLSVPMSVRSNSAALSDLVVTSGSGMENLRGVLKDLQPSGSLAPVSVKQPAAPLSLGMLAALQTAADPSGAGAVPTPLDATAIAIGEDECQIVFAKDQSADRFPFGMLFRLTDPALSEPSVAFSLLDMFHSKKFNYFGPLSPGSALSAPGNFSFTLTQRVPIDRPISIDGFRDGIVADTPWGGVPIAGSLAIGYVVRMAQRWTPVGLALGDLVYSLPLAPGEQQRIAITERSSTTRAFESEQFESREQISFSELDTTSAHSIAQSAFDEVANGGSHYETESSSGSIGASLGGNILGFLSGGIGGSFGSSGTSGDTSNWMSAARHNSSQAAEDTHSAVNRYAAASRSSARTSVRLASASESDQVVTKVITNHNKTRALTMQYWEVQRLFDVRSVTEGVTLVCMIPLDIVRFLPYGQPTQLDSAPDTRKELLARYARLLGHADILDRVVPTQYRPGIAHIRDFAADPSTAVGTATGPAEDVLRVTLNSSALPFEDIYVTIVGKRGVRLGPTMLTPLGYAYTFPTGKDAPADEKALFGLLRSVRTELRLNREAHIALPPSFPRQDIVGFEITRRFRRLDYTFPPPQVASILASGPIFNAPITLSEAMFGSLAALPAVSTTFLPDRLEQEIGGPIVTTFSVTLPIAAPPPAMNSVLEFVANEIFGEELPTGALPVAARATAPVLSYASILEIEKTLQWVMRNTMSCSIAVFSSLTREERAVLLERYEISLPPNEDGTVPDPVPLLSCITNSVLSYFGNSIVMPFMIPAEMTVAKGFDDNGQPKLTTAKIQDALTRFHTDGFANPRSIIALPTKGVLGEAVLGHCSSAEKIDLTRFWNWQDSPGDAAPAIADVTMPSGSLAAGLTAPSALTGLTPQIQNFSMSPLAADTGLASALITAAAQQKDFDVSALANAANLGTLAGKTGDSAEAARKDAMSSATQLALKAMDTSAELAKSKKDKDADKGGAKPPTTASIHFALNESTLTTAPASNEVATFDKAIETAKAAQSKSFVVRGYASPEDPAKETAALAQERADAVIAHLSTLGITATSTAGGVLSGAAADYPTMRRVDVQFDYPETKGTQP